MSFVHFCGFFCLCDLGDVDDAAAAAADVDANAGVGADVDAGADADAGLLLLVVLVGGREGNSSLLAISGGAGETPPSKTLA